MAQVTQTERRDPATCGAAASNAGNTGSAEPGPRDWQKWGSLFALILVFWTGRWALDFGLQQRLHDEPVVFTESDPPRFRLDLNTATEGQLKALPNIGPRLARAIVTNREQLGPFEDVEELQRVRGVGPATLDTLRPMLRLSSEPLPTSPMRVSRQSESLTDTASR